MNQTKGPGRIVKTKTGIVGRTYNKEKLINGKVVVHTKTGNLLCSIDSLEFIGFID